MTLIIVSLALLTLILLAAGTVALGRSRRSAAAATAVAAISRQTVPLSCANTGCPLRLVCIQTDKRLAHRLTELGLTPGVELCIVHNAGGALLLAVRGSRVALGAQMAHKVQVELLP